MIWVTADDVIALHSRVIQRIGALMTQLLLKWNGYMLELASGELADLFIGIADGAKQENDLLMWIKEHLK